MIPVLVRKHLKSIQILLLANAFVVIELKVIRLVYIFSTTSGIRHDLDNKHSRYM